MFKKLFCFHSYIKTGFIKNRFGYFDVYKCKKCGKEKVGD